MNEGRYYVTWPVITPGLELETLVFHFTAEEHCIHNLVRVWRALRPNPERLGAICLMQIELNRAICNLTEDLEAEEGRMRPRPAE